MSIQFTIKCAICQTCASLKDEESWGTLYSCGHVFHEDCVAKALQFKEECPICRAPTRRPERHKHAQQHRIYLPLAPQSAPDISQNPDTIAIPGRLIVRPEEYSAKISEAEELRKEVRELQSSIKEEARKLEATTAALQEESKKLRVKELEVEDLRDKAGEERLRLAEDVLVKERELKKLREEKHTMKSQLEQQANFYKGKAAREEREKNQHGKEVSRLELLLNERLGSQELSAITKKLAAKASAAFQEEGATVALQNALLLRNEEYRHLLQQKKKLDSERRGLASKVSDQRKELHQLKARVELKACARAAVTPAQQQQQQGSQGERPPPIPYNTPDEEMFLVRLPTALGSAGGPATTQPGRPYDHRSASGGACADKVFDTEVVLDVGDDGGPDAAWAAEFAARSRPPVGERSSGGGQAGSGGADRPQAAAEGWREDGGGGGEGMELVSEAAPGLDGEAEGVVGEVACSLQDDSPDWDACLDWDEEEERRLLGQFEGTAVDVSVSAEDVSALLDRNSSGAPSSRGAGCPDTQPTSSSGPGRPPPNLSRLGGACSAAGHAAGPLDALGGDKENLRPQPQHTLGVQLARRWQADNAVASLGLDEAAIRSQESSRQPPARKRLKRLYSPDPDCSPAKPAPAEATGDDISFSDDDVIKLDCDAGDGAAQAALNWCQDSQLAPEDEAPRLSPPLAAAFQRGPSVQELSAGTGLRSGGAVGSGQQLSGDSLGTSSLRSIRDSGSSRWKQSFSHASSSLGRGVGQGLGSFLHGRPGCSSGGPNGQFVRRGADGKGGRTTVLKTGSLQQSGRKWPAVSHLGSAAAAAKGTEGHTKRRAEKARSAHGTALIAQFFKGPKS